MDHPKDHSLFGLGFPGSIYNIYIYLYIYMYIYIYKAGQNRKVTKPLLLVNLYYARARGV